MEWGLLITVAPIVYYLWRRYIRKPHKLEFDLGNVFAARFVQPGNQNNGHIGLGVYGLAITNDSDRNLTIKRVELHYSSEGSDYERDSYVLMTSPIFAPQKNRNVNAIVIQCPSDNLVLIDWENLRQVIGDRKVLAPGEVLDGSGYFVLHTDDAGVIRDISDTRIAVFDFGGRKTIHRVDVLEPLDAFMKVGGIIENRAFKVNEDGKFEFQ